MASAAERDAVTPTTGQAAAWGETYPQIQQDSGEASA